MPKKTRDTFFQSWKGLIDVIKASYKLAPFLVVVMAAVITAVTLIAILSAKLMMGVVLLLVLGVTIVVYATTEQFGEATLALVAGILTAYSVTWTPSRFIAFIVVWSAFSFIALMIASLKIAGKNESIFRQASIALSESEDEQQELEKKLRGISDDRTIQGLGPIERAETILFFSFRKMPLEIIPAALKSVAILSVITQIEPKKMAVFIADVFKISEYLTAESQTKIVDFLYDTIKRSAVPPLDFIRGFERSRHLILGKMIDPLDYFTGLKIALESGVSPDECGQAIMAAREESAQQKGS